MRTRIIAGILAGVAISTSVIAAEQRRAQFDVPAKDFAKAQELSKQFAALSPRVDPSEAKLLAEYAYATVAGLRQQYQMFGTPIFNNFLVYHGLRKRGY